MASWGTKYLEYHHKGLWGNTLGGGTLSIT